MTNLIRIAHNLPVLPLLNAVKAQPALWSAITARQDHPMSAHKDTEAIFLRWAAGLDVPSVFNDLHAVEYPAFHTLHRQVWPLLDLMYANVGGRELGRAMLVNLKPGGFITPHVDEGAYADHYERFHLSLHSAADNFFHVDGDGAKPTETVHMKAGELWWFNHKRPHWVANCSDEPRIHLIVDIVAPKYRRERLTAQPAMECTA